MENSKNDKAVLLQAKINATIKERSFEILDIVNKYKSVFEELIEESKNLIREKKLEQSKVIVTGAEAELEKIFADGHELQDLNNCLISAVSAFYFEPFSKHQKEKWMI